MSKVTTSVSIDTEIKQAAKKKGITISTFLEEKLKIELQPDKQIQYHKHEILKKENEIKYHQDQIKQCLEILEQNKITLNHRNREQFHKAVQTCTNIYTEHGVIGENQLKQISNFNDIDFIELKTQLESQEIPITKYAEPPKHGKIKNLL